MTTLPSNGPISEKTAILYIQECSRDDMDAADDSDHVTVERAATRLRELGREDDDVSEAIGTLGMERASTVYVADYNARCDAYNAEAAEFE